MPFDVIRAQVAWDHDSGLPEDRIVNTFHFSSILESGATSTDYDDIISALVDFYDATHFTSSGVAAILSNRLTGNYTIDLYNLSDPEPRAPVAHVALVSATFTGASPPLPEEVAVCLSYAAEPVSGQSQARRRGRIYVGPLGEAVVDANARVRTNEQTILCRAARALSNNTDVNWCVYSRVANTFARVSHGWVDNAFDIQRRRGPDPSARTLWNSATP